MKVGDMVQLKEIKINKVPFLGSYAGKIGRIVAAQEASSNKKGNKTAFFRIVFENARFYEDLAEWRLEKALKKC